MWWWCMIMYIMCQLWAVVKSNIRLMDLYAEIINNEWKKEDSAL